jgi:hypothetical protein
MITIEHLKNKWPSYTWEVIDNPGLNPKYNYFKAVKWDKYVAIGFEPHHTLSNDRTETGVVHLLNQLDEAA